tara:strand:+ start:882 stop:1526 length:645 start_codon:yes stop_codon:yes gene_type:complete
MYDIDYIGISVISSIGFFLIDFNFPEYKINKYSTINYTGFVNAVITGIPSWYFYVTNKNLVNYLFTTDPLEINSHYKIIPLILYGYSFYDLYYGIVKKQLDFICHGLFLIFFMSVGIYHNSVHICLLGCIQEMSTIFLNIRINNLINFLFFMSFSYFRIYLFPKICFELFYTEPYNINLYYITLLALYCSNMLNFFWYCKMIRTINKMIYKMLL